MRAPRVANASRMTWVSSLARAPRRKLSPSARAAVSRARLVMLLEPGTAIVASRGPRGSIKSVAGSLVGDSDTGEASLDLVSGLYWSGASLSCDGGSCAACGVPLTRSEGFGKLEPLRVSA